MAYKTFKDIKNIYLLQAVRYDIFVHLLNKSLLVVTDSGGVQEEAFSLGKNIVIVRDKTERIELLKYQNVKLSGVKYENIIDSIQYFTDNKVKFSKKNIYGKKPPKKIVSYIKRYYE